MNHYDDELVHTKCTNNFKFLVHMIYETINVIEYTSC